MSLQHMQSVVGYSIMARNLRRDGYSCLQVADYMVQRLALDRFVPGTLDEEDRKRYEELRGFLGELERKTV
jgi:hypothetical protein